MLADGPVYRDAIEGRRSGRHRHVPPADDLSEQRRSEKGVRAFGIGPADHHKFFAVEALDLEPQAAIAGRVGCIGAFGDVPSSDIAQAFPKNARPCPSW